MIKKVMTVSSLLVVIATLLLSACGPSSNDTLPADQAKAQSAPIAKASLGQAAPQAPADQTKVQPTPAAAEAQAQPAQVGPNTSHANAVPVELELVLGTLNLEGTSLAVTQQQANVLLPLWSSLVPSAGGPPQADATPAPPSDNSEAQSKLIAQIQAAMTSEQIKAISDMQITQETAKTIMEKLGITMGQPQQGGGPGGGGQPPQGAPPAGGEQPPQGTPPAGGPGSGPGGAGGPPGQPPVGGRVLPELINALVQLLQKRAAGS